MPPPTTTSMEPHLSIRNALLELRNLNITSPKDSDRFLQRFSPDMQKIILAAVLLGRDHLHKEELRDDIPMDTSNMHSLFFDEYPQKLYEIQSNIELYINSLIHCAENSNFNLENINIK